MSEQRGTQVDALGWRAWAPGTDWDGGCAAAAEAHLLPCVAHFEMARLCVSLQ